MKINSYLTYLSLATNKAFIVIIFFTLFCCNNKSDLENISKVRTILSDCEFCIKDPNYILVIPSLGCTGCISQAESFMIENNNNENILFLLDKVSSRKDLRTRLGFDFMKSKNIFVSSEALNLFDNFIYPKLVNFETGEISDIEDFSSLEPLIN